ncbi:hypothetical protein B0O99DRAFT_640887 [Bisporella sp. PMI_857]|nr:hypothetical protein B0O99DRAFT_640887 [Bisporella sp. PMI_857]
MMSEAEISWSTSISPPPPPPPVKTQIRNACACEACCASKSRCSFHENQSLRQRCAKARNSCAVRTKARPMRARGGETPI